jgi:hypothetical protein
MQNQSSKMLSRLLGIVVLGVVMVGAAVGLLMVMPTAQGQAQGPAAASQEVVKRAYIVVGFGENDVIVRPITFTGEISAFAALQRTGLDVEYAVHPTYGQGICVINGVGTGVEPDGQSCTWAGWSYLAFSWENGAWAERSVGAGSAMITEHGHVEGFEWSNAWPPISTLPEASHLLAASRGLQYLMVQQSTSTGGYPGTMNDNAEVGFAVSANRCQPTMWQNGTGNPSLMDYVEANGPAWVDSGNASVRLGKLNTAMASSQVDVESWQGLNLVLSTTNLLSATGPSEATYFHDEWGTTSGMYHAWAMLGLQSASQTVPVSATNWLTEQQLPNGGWESGSWDMGSGTTDATALSIMALAASGVQTDDAVIVDGIAYLESAQGSDGGFPNYYPLNPWTTQADPTSPESTALVIQALLAVGENPMAARWTVSGNTPYDYILDMQLPDGSFEHSTGGGSDLIATRQAVIGLLGSPFPLRSDAEASVCVRVDVHNLVHLPCVIK